MSTVEATTTALVTESAPDNKTRRYDRQLRLWAASGQSALENARILVVSGGATATSILKNLVLPGVGHFTILDPLPVTPEDAGNNFFLDGLNSVGKSRAEEGVRLLLEMNDGVDGKADTRSLEEVLDTPGGKEWLGEFTLVIAVNLEKGPLERLAAVLWEEESFPPLVVVRPAGFLAEFYIQYHEHTVIESHPETAQSLQIDRPFPALLDYAMSLDFENMDVTDHGHVPYVVILVRVLEEWKKTHDGLPPQNAAEKVQFKKNILAMRKKPDEENFEEAEAQAYRAWTKTVVPSETRALFDDAKVISPSSVEAPFYKLVRALKKFVEGSGALPLTSTLPDMKASTSAYIDLQKLYKTRAEEEKEVFRGCLSEACGGDIKAIGEDMIDAFVKNSHALKLLRGKRWAALDEDHEALVLATQTSSKQLAVHLALSALSNFLAKSKTSGQTLSAEALTAEAQKLLPDGTELPEEFEDCVGEVVRSPTAELPNTAALLGGLVAQEAIKMITRQYVPINGYCIVDLVETWTGIL
ncbi:NEDD8-activating enzyme E1 regulatory subunit [Psilocybe cubensis]|uniref:NEDD8-activating enzyme E1 regulatory subunit n=2 Tax=Psilocybe cubensis TaxID=181762 RepID=A0A8H7XKG1_PSICU|nr:NEDD8-activating enzyme E1 regulatory subunit [Psilocybe cubensis]KAH9476223.1 NEDD8-activating enzyme E1 regulatory subunit [Psilocybe cubensis]